MTTQPINTWFLNKIIPINGPEKMVKKFIGKLGEIYLQCKLLPPGEAGLGERPQLLEDITTTTAKEKIKGKLIVYVASVTDVIPEDGRTCDPLVEVTFNKKTLATEKREKTLNAEFNKKLEFNVDFDSVDLVPLTEIDVKDWDMIRNDQIGHATVDLRACFTNPNIYAFNEVLKLEGPPNLVGKYRTFGSVYIQAKYLPEGQADTDNFAPMKLVMADHLTKNMMKGKIVIMAVHGKYIMKQGGNSDPMLRFTFPNKEKRDTKHINKTLYPVWNERIECPIQMTRTDAGFIDVEVLDHDLLTKNDSLGTFVVDIDPCYSAPNTWAVNKVFTVDPPKGREKDLRPGDCGTVYLAAKFVPEGAPEDATPFVPADTSPEEDRKREGLYGKLKFVCKSARDLPDKDGWGKGISDPFVLITLPDGQKKKTKVIDNNLNPDWNEVLEFDVKLDKTMFKPIEVQVRDDDNVSSDLCGFTYVGLDAFKRGPNTWALNEILPLKDGDKVKGSLYLQGIFIPEGAQETPNKPNELPHPKP